MSSTYKGSTTIRDINDFKSIFKKYHLWEDINNKRRKLVFIDGYVLFVNGSEWLYEILDCDNDQLVTTIELRMHEGKVLSGRYLSFASKIPRTFHVQRYQNDQELVLTVDNDILQLYPHRFTIERHPVADKYRAVEALSDPLLQYYSKKRMRFLSIQLYDKDQDILSARIKKRSRVLPDFDALKAFIGNGAVIADTYAQSTQQSQQYIYMDSGRLLFRIENCHCTNKSKYYKHVVRSMTATYELLSMDENGFIKCKLLSDKDNEYTFTELHVTEVNDSHVPYLCIRFINTESRFSNTYEEHFFYSENRPEEQEANCFIATCVYGTYDCPEIWTLRRFRDHYMLHYWYGRLFIKLYYRVSPIFISFFGNRESCKNKMRKLINYIVKKIRVDFDLST